MKYTFLNATVFIDPDSRSVLTQFDDGLAVEAMPTVDEESIARARALGYEKQAWKNLGGRLNEDFTQDQLDAEMVWLMTQDHDLFHTLIAETMGRKYSASLRPVAEGVESPDKDASDAEERLVFLLQRAMNEGYRVLPEAEDADERTRQAL